MTPAPARLGLLFALTLALPALFAGAWIWLVPGGLVERTRAGERHAAEQALASAAGALNDTLRAAAERSPIVLQLDAQRHVAAPFAAGPATPAAAIGIAEQAAGSRLANGDLAGALPFFAHAAADDTLSPEGWLRWANATRDRDVLARGLARHPDTCCAGVPFALLAVLATADWWPAAGGPPRSELLTRALACLPRVPAEALPPMLDALATTFPEAPAAHVLAVRTAAAIASHHRTAALPAVVTASLDGAVLVPLAHDRIVALPATAVAAARSEAFAIAERTQPTTQLAVATPTDALAETPHCSVLGLAETWLARASTTPTSTLLRLLAHACLALAVVTLVFGNLWLWRSTRRELALVRLRADFVDVVSHELRTPLTALSLKAEMLAAGDVPAERAPHYLRALHADVRRLADQVERILDFGRLEKGAALRRERLPARTVLARGLRAGRPALRLVAQQLTVDAPRELPAIAGDVDVLARALRNLLENAAKYAPAGSIVAVRAFAERDELVIEVADRGPGVPAAERAGVFQPFVRGSTANGGTPGSGLGLALVAAAARVHRGSAEVHERDGGGAVFTLRLPAAHEAAS